jgi:hypothetical protein
MTPSKCEDLKKKLDTEISNLNIKISLLATGERKAQQDINVGLMGIGGSVAALGLNGTPLIQPNSKASIALNTGAMGGAVMGTTLVLRGLNGKSTDFQITMALLNKDLQTLKKQANSKCNFIKTNEKKTAQIINKKTPKTTKVSKTN